MKPEILQAKAELIITVTNEMTASLNGTEIHPVYSTFWLAYHAECVARKTIEPYFEPGDNAVGGAITLIHKSMAAVGATIRLIAEVELVAGNRIICAIKAFVQTTTGEHCIAEGSQTQIVLPQSTITTLIQRAYQALDDKPTEKL